MSNKSVCENGRECCCCRLEETLETAEHAKAWFKLPWLLHQGSKYILMQRCCPVTLLKTHYLYITQTARVGTEGLHQNFRLSEVSPRMQKRSTFVCLTRVDDLSCCLNKAAVAGVSVTPSCVCLLPDVQLITVLQKPQHWQHRAPFLQQYVAAVLWLFCCCC